MFQIPWILAPIKQNVAVLVEFDPLKAAMDPSNIPKCQSCWWILSSIAYTFLNYVKQNVLVLVEFEPSLCRFKGPGAR